jgi:hypothetical protein
MEEKLAAERKNIIEDRSKYETDPQFRKAVNHGMGKYASSIRQGASLTVTVMFLTATALEMLRREQRGNDINLDIPVTGG